MKEYKIIVKNSDEQERDFLSSVVVKSEKEVQKRVDELNEKHKYDFRYEFVTELSEPEDEPVEDDSEETLVEDGEESITPEDEETEDILDIDYTDEPVEEDFPQGWHRRNEYVAMDGSYYMKGDLVEDEYRQHVPSLLQED